MIKEEKKIKSFDKTGIFIDHYKNKNRDAVIVICHGFLMSKDAGIFCEMADDFAKKYDVVVMDQRGHGKSEGSFSFISKEHQDIKAVIEYAKSGYKNVFLMGFSLGAASSIIEVAKEKNVNGLIAVSPPAHFERIENMFLHPDSKAPGNKGFFGDIFKVRYGNLFLRKEKPVKLIENISPIPLLIIHGKKDKIIFKWHSEILFENAKEPKEIIMIEDGLHAEMLYEQDKAGFINRCVSWINSVK